MNKSIYTQFRLELKFVLLLLSAWSCMTVNAQRDFTLYSLDGAPQAHYLNPAFRPKAKVFISLPLGLQSFSASNSGFTLNQLLKTRTQDDSLEFDPAGAISKMAKINYLTFESHNELLGFGFALKDNYFSFSATNRLQTNLAYPKDLFRFAFEGNGNFLGERASLDGFAFNLTSYVEYAFGYNRKINEKLSVGGRIKLLSGIANVRTKKSELGIYTDATTFDITIDGSLEVNTSGVKPFYDTLVDSYNPLPNAYSFKNSGIGLDLGATYALNEKINLSASLLDLGTIKWKTDNANFVTNNVNYRFEGVDFNEYLKDSVDVIGQLSDTLEEVFSQKENADSYRTSLYTRFYIGGTFALTKQFSVGATLYNEFIRARYRPGLILSGNVKLNNWFAATVNYSAYARSYNNVGIGFTIKGGPIQYYLITDNVFGFLSPQSAKYFHVSMGLNLLIGKDKKKEKTKPAVEG